MLQLIDITKAYETAGFKQTALDRLSVTFRDNEFAAILGPSGSGKTTLLNIIGGLDRSDAGELKIDGVSTALYKDRDWDTYRNNRIGFVFQSYNLIAHQSVLANVELALTLSGVSKAERAQRATQVLSDVGLADHLHKKPSQLSGGQMQRVAIARALVNDPKIMLADEPTGALDSKTSLQIMDLLTHIAKDRLVIMVTHNPDLARDYATRTVTLADGRIVDDSDPFLAPAGAGAGAGAASPQSAVKRSSMGFLSALGLSFSNLMTKKGRSFMTAFAGSIGIIGIAAILALATGVNNYIANIEKETLSQYPLSIYQSGFDLGSLLANAGMGGPGASGGSSGTKAKAGSVGETGMVASVLKTINKNDLASLKKFLDNDHQSHIQQHVNALEYSYDVTPQIYLGDTSKAVWQANPDLVSTMMSGGSSMTGAGSTMNMGMGGTGVFNALPRDTKLVSNQYDVVAGHWPKSYNECVLVLMPNGTTSDYVAYILGLRDPAALQKMVEDFSNQKQLTQPSGSRSYPYSEILGLDLRFVQPATRYTYDANYKVFIDHGKDTAYMKKVIADAERLHISGIIRPKKDSNLSTLHPGVCYSPELIDYLMRESAQSAIVKAQLAKPGIDVFTGKTFAEANKENGMGDFDMSKMLSIDQDALSRAMNFDPSSLGSLDMSAYLNPDDLMKSMPRMPPIDMSSALAGVTVSDLPTGGLAKFASATLSDYLSARSPELQGIVSDQMTGFAAYLQTPAVQARIAAELPGIIDSGALNNLATQVLADYLNYCGTAGITDPNAMIAGFPAWVSQPAVSAQITAQLAALINTAKLSALIITLLQDYLASQNLSSDTIVAAITTDFSAWLGEPGVAAKVQGYFNTYVDLKPLMNKISAQMSASLGKTLQSFMTQFMAALQQQLGSAMSNAGKQLSGSLGALNMSSLGNIFKFNLSQDQLAQLVLTMMGAQKKSLEANLKQLGYADPANPASILIYPKDFAHKQGVITILSDYNARMKKTGQKSKVIVYTDLVGALMKSVTSIIDTISYVLITFVSISLVVSSIMIGIVTYISVLERKKEIGILRSIGASKGNISNVFNAETLIIGLAAGLLGVGAVALLCIPANLIVQRLLNVSNIAHLPLAAAAILVAISCLLSFVAGLIPAAAAARRDPVEALRSE